MKKKVAVIIGARGLGDLIYHLPLLRSLHKSYNEKLLILSNRVNKAAKVFKDEIFYKKIIYFDNDRLNLFRSIIKSIKFRNYLNKFQLDQIILTSNARRLVLPTLLSNAKKKIFFGIKSPYLVKDRSLDHLTISERLIRYTRDLKLPKKINNFYLKNNKINNQNHIFISVDSHHDQNNWPLKNYLEIINKLNSKFKIFLNFSPNKKYFLNFFLKNKIKIKNIVFTHNKDISEIIEIIKGCKIIIGNESGPVCLGASYKKIVHAIYIPLHTKPESQIIYKKNKYYNTSKISDKMIIKKIINSINK